MKRTHLLVTVMAMLFSCSALVTAQNRSGTYTRKDKWGFGQLVVTSGKSSVSFKLNVGRTGKRYSDYCVGELDGRARWISANIAEYNSDFSERNDEGEPIGCRLTFIFSGNTITIRENDCNGFHGVMCNFEGKYLRPTPKKPKAPVKKLP